MHQVQQFNDESEKIMLVSFKKCKPIMYQMCYFLAAIEFLKSLISSQL